MEFLDKPQRRVLPWLALVAALPALATAPSPTTGTEPPSEVKALCEKVDAMFAKRSMEKSGCLDTPWTFTEMSEQGSPLLVAEFGRTNFNPDERPETTLVLGGVHGDEVTGIFLLFKEAADIHAQNSTFASMNKRIVVAPLVNPDGFFVRSRTNANGVDLNRNFPTHDWQTGALKLWKIRRKSSPIHFPGNKPASEAGSRFQMELIERFQPDKIISVHAPLNFIDYDGPGDAKRASALTNDEKKAKEIAAIIGRNSRGRKVVDYPFFPGSLGNYAGNERGIPTITLELASSQPRYAKKFWMEFRGGLSEAIQYNFTRFSVATREDDRE